MLDIKHLKIKIKHYIYYNTKDKSFQIVKKKKVDIKLFGYTFILSSNSHY